MARSALIETAETKCIRMLECEMGYDHVHMLIDVPEGQTLSSLMHRLKGASAHRLFQRIPDLKLDLRHASFWQRGYGYRMLEPSELFRVRRYIRNHREEPEPRVFNPRGDNR